MKKTLVVAAALILFAFSLPDHASAQVEVPDAVKQATVRLTAIGEVEAGRRGDAAGTEGSLQTSFATGAIITQDGFILTTYHLISQLFGKGVNPKSIKLSAQIDRAGDQMTVFIVDARPSVDLLLLKIQRDDNFSFIPLGVASSVGSGDPIYTYGFPVSGSLTDPEEGYFGTRDLEGGYLWAVNDMTFSDGESGSPILSGTNELVAVAKGELMGNGRAAAIPVEYADSLLSFIRFRELRASVEDIKAGSKLRGIQLPNGLDKWISVGPSPGGGMMEHAALNVLSSHGFCYLTGMTGLNDNRDVILVGTREELDLSFNDHGKPKDEFVIAGNNVNGGNLRARVRCLKHL